MASLAEAEQHQRGYIRGADAMQLDHVPSSNIADALKEPEGLFDRVSPPSPDHPVVNGSWMQLEE